MRYYGDNVINLSHMRRGGVFPLPVLVAILREVVNSSSTLTHIDMCVNLC